MKYFFLFSFSILLFACNNPHPSVLPFNGSKIISVSKSADSLELKAADVLQKYFGEIEQVDWKIEGNGQSGSAAINLQLDEKMTPHSIHYFIDSESLNIKGGSGQSLLNAVYAFLEKEIGVGFYSPTVTEVPLSSEIKIPRHVNFKYTPAIQTRTVHSRLFYEHHDFADARRVTHEAFPNYAPSARVHTFHKFLPDHVFFERHPEYYALRKGKRRTTQLCLTNEDVVQIVKDSVANLIMKYPEAKVISVSQDDNHLYCQCEACESIHRKEETAAGSMIHFVNQIAEAFPNIQISTLAYQYTRKAPKYVKPNKNVLITLCSIECDRSAPIDQKCTDFSNDLVEWGKLTDNIRIWDYTTQFTNFLAPFPNLYTLQPNVQLFRNNNAKWIFEQHSNQPSELFELRSYLTSKLLWDPEIDFHETMTEFLMGYYKEGGPFVRSYIDRIHEEMAKDDSFFLFLYGDPSQGFDCFLKKELLIEYDQYFEDAIKTVGNNPEIVKRLNEARLSTDYAILEYAKTELISAATDTFIDLDRRLERFANTCQNANITAMNETRYTVENYLQLYENTTQRLRGPNVALGQNVDLSTMPKKYANENPMSLTDGAFGGASFYANWLGFEGNDMVATIDLVNAYEVSKIQTAFLQVTNHIVFFPQNVEVLGSIDGVQFERMAVQSNQFPLSKKSKINDIQYFNFKIEDGRKIRFIRLKAANIKTAPEWHNSSGLPAWIFCDEVTVR